MSATMGFGATSEPTKIKIGYIAVEIKAEKGRFVDALSK